MEYNNDKKYKKSIESNVKNIHILVNFVLGSNFLNFLFSGVFDLKVMHEKEIRVFMFINHDKLYFA